MEPTDALHRAIDQIVRVVDGIGTGDFGRPTTCTDFDVRGSAQPPHGVPARAGGRGHGRRLGPERVRAAFAPAVAVASDAFAGDRLAGFTGRAV